MSAYFNWNCTYGTSSGLSFDMGAGGNLFNFKDYNDMTDYTDYDVYPVTIGTNSYEVWLRCHFSGSFTSISGLQFYKESGALGTGEAIKWKGNGQQTYTEAVKTTSTVATADVPTSDPGATNVSIGGSLLGALTSTGYSDYIVLQLQTTAGASIGDTESFVFRVEYTES